MAAKAARRPTGRTIEVERVVSVGRDRELKGGAIVRLRDERGAMLAVRLRPGQVRTRKAKLLGIWACRATSTVGDARRLRRHPK